jgi:hypothetical protein
MRLVRHDAKDEQDLKRSLAMDMQTPRSESDIMHVPEHDATTSGIKTTTEVRQGVTGHGVRYVLVISLALSIVALFLAWTYLT